MYIDNYGRIMPGDPNELCHHGVKGMHWGIRRYQPYPSGYNGDGKYTGYQIKKSSDKVLNGYSAQDVQRYFDSVPKGDSEYGLKHKDYKETIYRDVPDGKGFIEFYRLPEERHVASIAISVHPNERHKGIASSMIEKGKAHMGELGIDRLEWYCKKSNKASVNLALKNGFKVDKLHSNSEWYTMYYKKDSNNTNLNVVTTRVKALRSSGMTYADIAKKLGISESSVGHYLNL